MERATARERQTPFDKDDIQYFPAFRSFLQRQGIDFKTWQNRQNEATDKNLDAEALQLQKRKLSLTARGAR